MQQTIAVIGAGFSGTLLALHLLRRCPPTTSVVLIERNSGFGRGQAYATGNANHLLNVPAGRMSAFRDRPDDFVAWLQRQAGADGTAAPAPGAFISRGLFGNYVRHLLEVERQAPGRGERLLLLQGDVVGLRKHPGSLALLMADGREVPAGLAVLAVGNFPPELPPGADPGAVDRPWYRPDPWAPDTFSELDADAPVLLIGTGLSTVDGVVSLLDAGHRGPIHALSRRGLLPRSHARRADVILPSQVPPLPTALSALTRLVRDQARRRVTQGGSWHAVVDALRPFTQELWQAMAHDEKARFLRHLRPWWDVHRHRMAVPVAERIEAALASGQFRIHVGRIRQIRDEGDGAAVDFRRRADGQEETLTVARIVNCAGPGCDYDRIRDPLVRDLLATGHARPDPFRLGLDITGACAVRAADGAISRRIFAVGPVTKAAFWEMTAVPDIRRQCEALAEHLAAVVAVSPPLAVPAV
ncbi:FAD/NAD(P)-binding protein [Neoroseomonas terrae]|uniref:FAD/NAD(P)-binding protein n=1 Tax=Neoroseomonas terrae TaxID=424799 RepID=UPI001BA9CB12